MTAAPANLQQAGEQAVTVAARAVREAFRGFPRAIDCAKRHGVDDARVLDLCKAQGVDWALVRELLDGDEDR